MRAAPPPPFSPPPLPSSRTTRSNIILPRMYHGGVSGFHVLWLHVVPQMHLGRLCSVADDSLATSILPVCSLRRACFTRLHNFQWPTRSPPARSVYELRYFNIAEGGEDEED